MNEGIRTRRNEEKYQLKKAIHNKKEKQINPQNQRYFSSSAADEIALGGSFSVNTVRNLINNQP